MSENPGTSVRPSPGPGRSSFRPGSRTGTRGADACTGIARGRRDSTRSATAGTGGRALPPRERLSPDRRRLPEDSDDKASMSYVTGSPNLRAVEKRPGSSRREDITAASPAAHVSAASPPRRLRGAPCTRNAQPAADAARRSVRRGPPRQVHGRLHRPRDRRAGNRQQRQQPFRIVLLQVARMASSTDEANNCQLSSEGARVPLLSRQIALFVRQPQSGVPGMVVLPALRIVIICRRESGPSRRHVAIELP